MRPKLLEIEGLQSFRHAQIIDFEALGETGLFGIFGPTGSGKSTVLDAITFALYGKVKRAERGTQGIINTNMKTAKVSFTFELLKDNQRKTYRVERYYQRKKSSNNACEAKIARLIEVTCAGEIPVCDKVSEISTSVEELIGLNHEDFTRAVVLPQNSFQEFLLLDNSKKRDMLERIFYLEEYGKQLWEKVYHKIAVLKSRIDILYGELRGYQDATDDVLNEAKKVFDATVSERNRVEKELKQLETRYNVSKELWQNMQDLILVNEREDHQNTLKSAINEKRIILEKAIKADALVPIINKNVELELKLKNTEFQLEEVKKSLPDIEKNLNEILRKYNDIQSETLEKQPQIISLKTKLIDALSIKKELNVIQNKIAELEEASAKIKDKIAAENVVASKSKQQFSELEEKMYSIQSEIKSLSVDPEYRHQIQEGIKFENDLESFKQNKEQIVNQITGIKDIIIKLEQNLGRVRKDISISQNSIDDTNNEIQKYSSIKPENRNSVLEYKEKIHIYKTASDILNIKKAEISGLENKISKQNLSIKELEERISSLQQLKENTQRIYDLCKLEFNEAVSNINRNAAFLLSNNLNEGDPCPVCGSEHHPNPATSVIEDNLSELDQYANDAEKRMGDAEKAFKEAEKDCLVNSEQLKALITQNNQYIKDLELSNSSFNSKKIELPEELRNLDLDQIHVEIDKMYALCNEKFEAFESWEKTLEELNNKLQTLNESCSNNKMIESGILAEIKVNNVSLNQLEKSLELSKVQIDEKKSEYINFLDKYKLESVSNELKRLTDNDRKVGTLQEQMEQISKSTEGKRTLIEKCKDEIRELNEQLIKFASSINSLKAQKYEKEDKIKTIAGNVNIEDEIKRIDEKLEEYIKLEKLYKENLETVKIQHDELITRSTSLKNQQDIYSESLSKEMEFLKSSIYEKGFGGIEEVEKSIKERDIQISLKNEIDEYNQVCINIQGQKEIILKKLNSRSITEEEWNEINNNYHQLLIYKEECVSNSEVSKNNFNILKNKHDKWSELNSDYNEKLSKYGLLEQIQKLLRAERGKDNSFIDYIAEERLRYVASKASETLGIMTKYKYGLELDTESGFIIRDNVNGGVHRMVSSLSGGETFLTSLSLALALSEQIQLKGQSPLEFFFLDEGFGTLDNNLLDTVIDSLERLSKKERVVGIITHVPELRSRIARRLIVEPPSSQGEGSRVRIEKA